MSKLTKDNARNKRRKKRSKRTLNNFSNRPRLVVSRSLKNIQAQIIDDFNGATLVSVSSLDKSLQSELSKVKGKVERSKIVGKKIGEKAKKNKIEINNSIKSHIKDGVALTKFIYWIKNNKIFTCA